MERAIILSGSEPVIHSRHLGLPQDSKKSLGEVKLAFDGEPSLEEVRRFYVEMLFKKYSGHRGKLADALGVSERNLYRLLHRYGLG